MTRIGKETFAGDISLSQVTLSDNLEAIPARAFYGCSSLQEISLPVGVKWIGKEAFGSNSSLTAVGISPGVERVEASAFKSCSNLARVDISDLASWCNITFADPQANPLYMARRLYLDGEELHDMAIPAGVKSINDYAFSRYEGLTSLTMSNDVESIGEEAFLGCKQMTSATIGNGVRTIGEKAFNGCSKLTDVTFGNRVDSVGMYSFGSCNALTKITSRAITPPYMRGPGSFSDKAYKNATVYVPRQSLEEYKVALVWKRFSHLEGVNFKAERADVNGDGEVTIADVNCLIDALIWGSFSDSFDVNEDGELTIADVNAVIDVILTGQ